MSWKELRSRQGGGQHDLARFLPKAVGATVVYARDTFTDTNGVILHSHTPTGTTPGTGWTDANGIFTDLTILNNRLVITGTQTSGTWVAGMGATVTPSSDQSVTYDLTFFTPLTNMLIGGGARCSGAGATGGYYLRYKSDSGTPANNGFSLVKYTDAFALSQLGATAPYSFPVSGTVAACEVRCVGTSISAYVDGALLIGPITDAAITGRLAGIFATPSSTAVNSTASTGVHLDNLVVQSYP